MVSADCVDRLRCGTCFHSRRHSSPPRVSHWQPFSCSCCCLDRLAPHSSGHGVTTKTQTVLRFPASCDCNSEHPRKKTLFRHSPSLSLCICINFLLLMLRTLLPFCRLAAKEIHIGGARGGRLVSTPLSLSLSHTHTHTHILFPGLLLSGPNEFTQLGFWSWSFFSFFIILKKKIWDWFFFSLYVCNYFNYTSCVFFLLGAFFFFWKPSSCLWYRRNNR